MHDAKLVNLWQLKTGSWAEHKSSVTSTAHVTRSSLASPRLMYMHWLSDVGRLYRKSHKISQTSEPEPDSDLKTGGRVVQGHWKWRCSIDDMRFLLVRHCIPSSKWYRLCATWRWNYRDLEIWVRGHWRSFKLVPFERLGAVSYSPSIVTMAVSLTVYEIFSVKE